MKFLLIHILTFMLSVWECVSFKSGQPIHTISIAELCTTTQLTYTGDSHVCAMCYNSPSTVNPRTPRGGWCNPPPPPLAFFPCNFFDDSNRKNRLSVSVTRDGRHILTYVTSSWRCHVTYVMTSYVHDGGQNTLFLPLFVNRDIFWCRCDKVMRLVSFSTKLRS